MGYVIFDEGCLWCRLLASFIHRVFNINTIPLRRAIENLNFKLSKGKIYIVDNGVKEGFKPLIKLVLSRSKTKSLRIIPSYITYKIARKTVKEYGCSYSRRIFMKGLITLALTTIITQKIPLTWSIEENKHPLLKAKFLKSIELKNNELNEAVKKMVKSKDVNNIVDIDKIDLSNVKAVKHILEVDRDGNSLIAIAIPLDDGSNIVYYILEKPIEWLETEAWLITGRREGISVTRSINGKIIVKSENKLDYSECSCIEECQNDWDCGGPPNTCAVGCCNGNDSCLRGCFIDRCLVCVPICASGNLPACIACVAVYCPIAFTYCWYDLCCNDYCKICIMYGGP